MKKSETILKWLALIPTALVILSVSYSLLNSSDFPRSIYSPPPITNTTAWQTFDELHANQIWYYWSGDMGTSSLYSFLYFVNLHGVKPILRGFNWTPTHPPFLVERYSYGQYDRWETEVNYGDALYWLNYNGTGYCFIDSTGIGHQVDNIPLNGASWGVTVLNDQAGYILKGPKETFGAGAHRYAWGEPRWDYPPEEGTVNGVPFQHRVRVMANFEPYSDPITTVFKWNLWHFIHHYETNTDDSTLITTKTVRVGDFNAPNQWQVFTINDTLHSQISGASYDVFWPDSVDLWVDWFEYYDLRLGYKLWCGDTSVTNPTWRAIVSECDSIESNYGNLFTAWAQSDEPRRNTIAARGLIYDYLRNHLKPKSTIQTVCK
ncbi:MAG: hypothetical protein NTW14_14905 [bacterium]|nr:hypothetical protein [bacterium]